MSVASSMSGTIKTPTKPNSRSRGSISQSVVFGNQEMVMATTPLGYVVGRVLLIEKQKKKRQRTRTSGAKWYGVAHEWHPVHPESWSSLPKDTQPCSQHSNPGQTDYKNTWIFPWHPDVLLWWDFEKLKRDPWFSELSGSWPWEDKYLSSSHGWSVNKNAYRLVSSFSVSWEQTLPEGMSYRDYNASCDLLWLP